MMLAMNSCKNNNNATKFSSTSGKKKLPKLFLLAFSFAHYKKSIRTPNSNGRNAR